MQGLSKKAAPAKGGEGEAGSFGNSVQRALTFLGKKGNLGKFIHPHQRCGYGDSPFARRKDTRLYCRVWKWVGRG